MTHIFGGLRGEGEQKQIEIAATDSLKPWLRGGGAEPLPLFSQLTRALLTIELTCRLNPALTRTHTAKG